MKANIEQLKTVDKILNQFIRDEKTGNIKVTENKMYYHTKHDNIYFKVTYKGFDSGTGQVGTQVEWYCIKKDGSELDCKGHFGGQSEAIKFFSEMIEIKL